MISGPEGTRRRSDEGIGFQAIQSSPIPPRIDNVPPQKGMSDAAYKMHGIEIPLDPKKTRARLDEMPCMDG
ncbi:MAG TPA: hypothetical protein VJ065_00305 [Patescibacteria group bacterium]|nr:hypothetical protein [Patescibacteria group bacterium]